MIKPLHLEPPIGFEEGHERDENCALVSRSNPENHIKTITYDEPEKDKANPCKECGQPTISFKCADCIIGDKKNWNKKI